MTAILDRRGRWNLRMNLLISTLLVFFGVSSLVVSALSKAEENFFLEFRYMTVNGTVFTTLISLIIAIVCVTQMATGRQLRLRQLSYLRLCSAVTETIIGVVILLSLFPFVPDNPNILTYDSFPCMSSSRCCPSSRFCSTARPWNPSIRCCGSTARG